MEAMSIVRQSTIDLVISDVHMPAVDGIQLAAMLRGQYPACALLLMSGTVPEPLAKPYPFLPKPFGPRLLLERVNQLLQVRATEDFVDRR